MTILLLLAGIGFIILGTDRLVDGSSAFARKAGVSEFVIGLTIVGFGTSCPELVESLTRRKCCIDRWAGAIMLLTFAAYYYYLFTKL